jgi:hypothetical protein
MFELFQPVLKGIPPLFQGMYPVHYFHPGLGVGLLGLGLHFVDAGVPFIQLGFHLFLVEFLLLVGHKGASFHSVFLFSKKAEMGNTAIPVFKPGPRRIPAKKPTLFLGWFLKKSPLSGCGVPEVICKKSVPSFPGTEDLHASHRDAWPESGDKCNASRPKPV